MLPNFLTTILLSLPLLTPTLSAPTTSIQTRTLSKRTPNALYQLGQLDVHAAGSFFLTLDNGVNFALQQSDNNFVVYQNGVAQWADHATKPAGCSSNNCELIFQGDGNLVSYFNGKAVWSSGTAGKGNTIAFYDEMPFIVIFNAQGTAAWHTPLPAGGGGGEPGGGGGGGGGGLGGLCKEVTCVIVHPI